MLHRDTGTIMLSLDSQKRAIISYITMKEGEGDYHKCTKCPRMYASEDLLEKHMQRKHSTDEVTTPIPREASNFGGVIQSTLQRRRDKTRQGGGVSASRANTFHPTASTGSAESGSRGMPTLHEDTTVKVCGRCLVFCSYLNPTACRAPS